jgi:tetratricopeptide (TPR) repeat protein
VHRERVDYEKAAEAYERAARIAPTSFDAHYYLGLMRQYLRQSDAAVQAYLYALAIEPNNMDANHHLASCYLQMGRPAEAVPYARRATELNSKSQAAWANLGAAYSLMNLYEKAVRAYREANEYGTFQAPVLTGLAEAHTRLGHYDRAIAVLDVVIKKQPSALAHERKAYALFKQKKYDDALANFRAALLFDANDPAALNGLGVCLMTKYIRAERKVPIHKQEAIQAWERSIELHPNQPRIAALIRQFGTL